LAPFYLTTPHKLELFFAKQKFSKSSEDGVLSISSDSIDEQIQFSQSWWQFHITVHLIDKPRTLFVPLYFISFGKI